jgi:hypothetical protein
VSGDKNFLFSPVALILKVYFIRSSTKTVCVGDVLISINDDVVLRDNFCSVNMLLEQLM